MYCSNCGTQIKPELNYCNRCGQRTNKIESAETSTTQNNILDTLATTTIFIGVGGMLFFVGLIAILLDKGIVPQVIVMLSVLYLAAWFGICFRLLGQISRVIDGNFKEGILKRNSEKIEKAESAQAFQIAAPTTAQLEEHREPVMSITEKTTRTLDKIESKI